ncbi:GNAT family N-acetyltransferase [Pararhizobium sp.]|uniref:GNAT family N-acetyltransferase n=1 Tax=Pararhizobium sp. TaxID=1977563 RepID=UPI002727C5BC|nr:GNAT family N-acetyltransferase [Pararhizobium sp.]MDO9414732.1 GNAT family N-acetyltransferase [Pararhizobium sp.]
MPDNTLDLQPELFSEGLILRPLTSDDFAGLYAAGSDPAVWAGHPAKNRYQEEAFRTYFDAQMASGSTLIFIDRANGKPIGCSRYYVAPDQPQAIAIGFTFLNNAYWGGSTNFEIKRLMLDHAFKTVDDVWFHIDPTNIRSQKATAKLGAVHAYDAVLDISGSPVNWMCFRLTRDAWEAVKAARG